MANRNDDWANDPRFDQRPNWGVNLDQPRWESRDFMTNQPYRERAEVEGFRNYPPVHYWDRPGGNQGQGGGNWGPGPSGGWRGESTWGRGPESAASFNQVSRNYGPGGENWNERNQTRESFGGYDRGNSGFEGGGRRETGGFGRSESFGSYGSYRGPDQFRGNNMTFENSGGMGRVGRYSGRGPRGYQRSDDRIREDVCEILTRHGDIDASEIDIEVNNGEVTLTGTVEDRYQKRLAEDVAEQVSGVRDIHNQIRVQQRGDVGSLATSGTTGRTGALGTTNQTGAGGTATSETSGTSRGRGGEERMSPTGTTSREGRRRAA